MKRILSVHSLKQLSQTRRCKNAASCLLTQRYQSTKPLKSDSKFVNNNHRLIDLKVNEHKQSIVLSEIGDESVFVNENVDHDFPLVWLRDNCQCDKCFHSHSTSRTIDWETFNVTPYTENVQVACKVSEGRLKI